MIQRRRNPLVWLLLIASTVAVGIGSRRFHHVLPDILAAYAGDTFWALALFRRSAIDLLPVKGAAGS